MKRVEAIVQSDKLGAVAEALKDKVGGFAVTEGKGRGSGARPKIRMGRGTGSMTAEYNTIARFMTIVDESQVEAAVSAISEAAFTGNPGDGIITISNIEDVVNISSKKRGSDAL